MSKVITITFDSHERGIFEMAIERGDVCREHTVLFYKLPLHSQVRFLVWAMSQNWKRECKEYPHGFIMEESETFTTASDGQSKDALQYSLEYAMKVNSR
jgi:hypothetical protein